MAFSRYCLLLFMLVVIGCSEKSDDSAGAAAPDEAQLLVEADALWKEHLAWIESLTERLVGGEEADAIITEHTQHRMRFDAAFDELALSPAALEQSFEKHGRHWKAVTEAFHRALDERRTASADLHFDPPIGDAAAR